MKRERELDDVRRGYERTVPRRGDRASGTAAGAVTLGDRAAGRRGARSRTAGPERRAEGDTRAGIDALRGSARFIGLNTISVDGRRTAGVSAGLRRCLPACPGSVVTRAATPKRLLA